MHIPKVVAYAAALLIFAGCQGPDGPPGPIGPQGPQGPPGTGGGGTDLGNEVFEIEIDFSAATGYFEAFVLDPPIGQNDVVLAFMLWDFVDGTDIWRALPQTNFLDEGILKYDYDFSRSDFALFMEATFNLDLLGPVWTNGQVFRIVLVPAQGLSEHGMPQTLGELEQWLPLEDRSIKHFRRTL